MKQSKQNYQLTPAMVAATEACSKDITRAALNCGHIRLDGRFEACDGHILAIVTPPALSKGQQYDLPDNGLLIHQDNIKEVGKIAKKDFATIGLINGSIPITAKTVTITAPLPDCGKYPDTDQVMPKGDSVFQISISAHVLLKLATIVKKSVSRADTQPIRLTFYDDKKAIKWETHSETENGEALSGMFMPCRN